MTRCQRQNVEKTKMNCLADDVGNYDCIGEFMASEEGDITASREGVGIGGGEVF